MKSRANSLAAVYNANPSLQKQYTLPQYLSLFDFSETPAISIPTSTSASVAAPTGIQSIVNQNLNQNLGGGEGPAAPPGSPSYEYNSTFASTNTTPEENLGYLDDIGEGTIDNVDDDNTFVGKIGNFVGGIGTLFSNLPTPFNLVRKAYEFTKQKDIEKKEQAAAIARENFREAMRQGRSFYDSLNEGKGASVSDKSREEAGPGYGDVSESGSFADGGRVYLYNRLK